MNFSRLLVVCEANICRSPVGEHLLRKLSGLEVDSAGLTAKAGEPPDPVYLDMTETLGLDLSGHRSKQLNRTHLEGSDLTLVMTPDQKRRVAEQYPEFSGRVMLLGHWIEGGISISDPHRKSIDAYREVLSQIQDACRRWSDRL